MVLPPWCPRDAVAESTEGCIQAHAPLLLALIHRRHGHFIHADNESGRTSCFHRSFGIHCRRQRRWSDSQTGHHFLEVNSNSGRRALPLTTPRVTTVLNGHLRAANVLVTVRISSFRVGDRSGRNRDTWRSDNQTRGRTAHRADRKRPLGAFQTQARWR